MSRGKVRILKVNGQIILETTITKNLRIQIPTQLKTTIQTPALVRVTIEKILDKTMEKK